MRSTGCLPLVIPARARGTGEAQDIRAAAVRILSVKRGCCLVPSWGGLGRAMASTPRVEGRPGDGCAQRPIFLDRCDHLARQPSPAPHTWGLGLSSSVFMAIGVGIRTGVACPASPCREGLLSRVPFDAIHSTFVGSLGEYRGQAGRRPCRRAGLDLAMKGARQPRWARAGCGDRRVGVTPRNTWGRSGGLHAFDNAYDQWTPSNPTGSL